MKRSASTWGTLPTWVENASYRKFRNVLRILMANLYDFDPARDSVADDRLEGVDRYLLSRYGRIASEMLASGIVRRYHG